MTAPIVPSEAVPVAPGVLADVQVLVISVDSVAGNAVIRVVDNNGNFLSPNATLPIGVIRPTQFQVVEGDVLEHSTPEAETAVVRWTDGLQWSESPSGVPARSTQGWKKLGNFDVTP
jgi:hypothetical protein